MMTQYTADSRVYIPPDLRLLEEAKVRILLHHSVQGGFKADIAPIVDIV